MQGSAASCTQVSVYEYNKVTHYMAGSLSVEQSIKVRDSTQGMVHDVISVAWLLRCCAAKKLLPVRPAEWLAISPAMRNSIEGMTKHADL